MQSSIDNVNILTGDKEGLLAAGFNSSNPVKITIHGFSDKGVTSWTDVSTDQSSDCRLNIYLYIQYYNIYICV